MPHLPQDKQDRAFCAHIEDLLDAAAEKYQTRFSTFLDLHQQKLARRIAAGHSVDGWMLFGGYDGAERVMLGAFPAYEQPELEAFPIVSLTITFRKEDSIGHRDLLGGMLSLGIKRETLGDILVEEGQAVCFLTEPAARIVELELNKVGRCGVKPVRGQPQILPAARHYQPCHVQISSLRLDCVVAALCSISREKAAQMIRAGLVQLDADVTQAVAFPVEQGAVLSLRGYGKFLFETIERTTRSGRLAVVFQKYV